MADAWTVVGYCKPSRSGKVLVIHLSHEVKAGTILVIQPQELLKVLDGKKDWCHVTCPPPKDLPSPPAVEAPAAYQSEPT